MSRTQLRAWEIALSAVLAALYAGLVVALGPVSFYALQVRVADALLPLSIVLGRPAIIGLALGCFIANFFGLPFPFCVADAILGSLANLAACGLGYRLGGGSTDPKKVFLATLAIFGVVTAVVGTYLPFLLVACGIPADLPFLSSRVAPPPLGLLLVGWVGVGLGSLVSVVVMGYLLLVAVVKAGVRPSPGTP